MFNSFGGVPGGVFNGEFNGVPVGEKDLDPVGEDITLGVKLIIDDAISLETYGDLSLALFLTWIAWSAACLTDEGGILEKDGQTERWTPRVSRSFKYLAIAALEEYVEVPTF